MFLAAKTVMEHALGYVSGMLCGRGHIIWNEKKGNYGASFESGDREIALFYSKCMQNALEIKTKTIVRKKTQEETRAFVVYCYDKESIKKIIGALNGCFGTQYWHPPKKTHTSTLFRKGFLMGFFDCKGHIRIRYKKRGCCFEKIRNLRVSSVNMRGLFAIKELLLIEGVASIIYRRGESHVIDIEGKARLHAYQKQIGFASSKKQKALQKAIEFLSKDELRVAGLAKEQFYPVIRN